MDLIKNLKGSIHLSDEITWYYHWLIQHLYTLLFAPKSSRTIIIEFALQFSTGTLQLAIASQTGSVASLMNGLNNIVDATSALYDYSTMSSNEQQQAAIHEWLAPIRLLYFYCDSNLAIFFRFMRHLFPSVNERITSESNTNGVLEEDTAAACVAVHNLMTLTACVTLLDEIICDKDCVARYKRDSLSAKGYQGDIGAIEHEEEHIRNVALVYIYDILMTARKSSSDSKNLLNMILKLIEKYCSFPEISFQRQAKAIALCLLRSNYTLKLNFCWVIVTNLGGAASTDNYSENSVAKDGIASPQAATATASSSGTVDEKHFVNDPIMATLTTLTATSVIECFSPPRDASALTDTLTSVPLLSTTWKSSWPWSWFQTTIPLPWSNEDQIERIPQEIDFLYRDVPDTNLSSKYVEQAFIAAASMYYRLEMMKEAAYELKNDELKSDLDSYVAVKASKGVNDTWSFDLLDDIKEHFLCSDKNNVMLIHGPAGSGKTLFCRHMELEFWSQLCSVVDTGTTDCKERIVIPIFINLSSIHDPRRFIIKETFKEKKFDQSNLSELRRDNKFTLLFILDGYDEIQAVDNLYNSNRFHEYSNAKVIITCRTEYLMRLGNYHSAFSTNKYFAQERHVKLFDKKQLKEFFLKLKAMDSSSRYANVNEYLADIKELEINDLKSLTSNPFKLRILFQVLPRLRDSASSSGSKPALAIDIVHILEEFIRVEFDSKKESFALSNPTIAALLKDFDAETSFEKYSMNLAICMFVHRKTSVLIAGNDYQFQYEQSNPINELTDASCLEAEAATTAAAGAGAGASQGDSSLSTVQLQQHTTAQRSVFNHDSNNLASIFSFTEKLNSYSYWDQFFSESNPLLVACAYGAPLTRIGRQICFRHKMFLDYFGAKMLFWELLELSHFKKIRRNVLENMFFNKRSVHEDVMLMRFLLDLIKSHLSREVGKQAIFDNSYLGRSRLIRVLFGTIRKAQCHHNLESTNNASVASHHFRKEKYSKVSIAAGNAITLLVQLGYDFSHCNLVGLHCKSAKLFGGTFVGVDFSNSKLTAMCWDGGNFSDAVFDNAILKSNVMHERCSLNTLTNIRVGILATLEELQTIVSIRCGTYWKNGVAARIQVLTTSDSLSRSDGINAVPLQRCVTNDLIGATVRAVTPSQQLIMCTNNGFLFVIACSPEPVIIFKDEYDHKMGILLTDTFCLFVTSERQLRYVDFAVSKRSNDNNRSIRAAAAHATPSAFYNILQMEDSECITELVDLGNNTVACHHTKQNFPRLRTFRINDCEANTKRLDFKEGGVLLEDCTLGRCRIYDNNNTNEVNEKNLILAVSGTNQLRIFNDQIHECTMSYLKCNPTKSQCFSQRVPRLQCDSFCASRSGRHLLLKYRNTLRIIQLNTSAVFTSNSIELKLLQTKKKVCSYVHPYQFTSDEKHFAWGTTGRVFVSKTDSSAEVQEVVLHDAKYLPPQVIIYTPVAAVAMDGLALRRDDNNNNSSEGSVFVDSSDDDAEVDPFASRSSLSESQILIVSSKFATTILRERLNIDYNYSESHPNKQHTTAAAQQQLARKELRAVGASFLGTTVIETCSAFKEEARSLLLERGVRSATKDDLIRMSKKATDLRQREKEIITRVLQLGDIEAFSEEDGCGIAYYPRPRTIPTWTWVHLLVHLQANDEECLKSLQKLATIRIPLTSKELIAEDIAALRRIRIDGTEQFVVDFDVVDSYSATPLCIAAQKGFVKTCEFLLNSCGAFAGRKGDRGKPPLSIAAQNNRLKVCKLLLAVSEIDINECDDKQQTALFLAARYSHFDVCQLLVNQRDKCGLSFRTKDTATGCTPLMIAIKYASDAVCKLLLEADVEAVVDIQTIGRSVIFKRIPIFDLLFRRISEDNQTNTAVHLLSLATKYGHISIVEAILKKLFSVDSQNNLHLQSIFSCAAQFGRIDVCKKYINRIALNDSFPTGNAPLKLAARFGHVDVVRLFLFHGAAVDVDANDKDKDNDDMGDSALCEACANGHLQVVMELLYRNASCEGKPFSPFLYAAMHGHLTICMSLAMHLKRKPFLAEIKCLSPKELREPKLLHNRQKSDNKPELADKELNAALILAAQLGHVPVVNWLLTKQNAQNIEDSAGMTAFVDAAMHGHWQVCECLFRKLSHYIPSAERIDALSFAARYNHIDTVKWLVNHFEEVESQATLSVEAYRGQREIVERLLLAKVSVHEDAIHMAAKGGFPDICDVLLDYCAIDRDSMYAIFEEALTGTANTNVLMWLAKIGFFVDCDCADEIDAVLWTCKEKNSSLLEHLIGLGANPESIGMPSNMFAHRSDNCQICSVLKKLGFVFNRESSFDSSTSTHIEPESAVQQIDFPRRSYAIDISEDVVSKSSVRRGRGSSADVQQGASNEPASTAAPQVAIGTVREAVGASTISPFARSNSIGRSRSATSRSSGTPTILPLRSPSLPLDYIDTSSRREPPKLPDFKAYAVLAGDIATSALPITMVQSPRSP